MSCPFPLCRPGVAVRWLDGHAHTAPLNVDCKETQRRSPEEGREDNQEAVPLRHARACHALAGPAHRQAGRCPASLPSLNVAGGLAWLTWWIGRHQPWRTLHRNRSTRRSSSRVATTTPSGACGATNPPTISPTHQHPCPRPFAARPNVAGATAAAAATDLPPRPRHPCRCVAPARRFARDGISSNALCVGVCVLAPLGLTFAWRVGAGACITHCGAPAGVVAAGYGTSTTGRAFGRCSTLTHK